MSTSTPLNIVCLGDSITADVADVTCGTKTGWIDQLQAAFPGDTFTNAGVPGNNLEMMSTRLQNYSIVPGQDNVMVIWGGTNDFAPGGGGPFAATAAAPVVNALATVVAKAEAAGWDAYVVSMLPRCCDPQAVADAYNAGARTLVDAAHFIDLAPLFQNTDGTANTSLYFETNTTGQWTHPDQQGDDLIASAMFKVVQSMTGVPSDVSGAGSLASLSAASGFGTVVTPAGSTFTWTPTAQAQTLASGC
jgi:lysophospholipase L1-like esterase